MMIEVLLIFIVSAAHALPSHSMCHRSPHAAVSSEDGAVLCAPASPQAESFARSPNWQPIQFPDGVIRTDGKREQEIKLGTESPDGDGDLRAAESFNTGFHMWPYRKPWSLFGHGHNHGFWPPPLGATPWGDPFAWPRPPLPFLGGWPCC
ncbi:uncharacterized protein LOC132256146 [Phlebotomus argentipes]|uniref:uncharacterized protein LOC132256146 n=1 Tax=Phlebotomus argentipes TaxID=94469 RepID=UPI002892BDD9|nr:uncharacterized protein LOC132256146 [Phlebotomus argentipes]